MVKTFTRKLSSKTMKHMCPRLVTAEIMLVEKRCPVPGITGVLPRGEKLRPA